MESPKRFYLICERREDGGLRVTSPEVPGLILSGADPREVLRDVAPAIDMLARHNGIEPIWDQIGPMPSDPALEAKLASIKHDD